MAVLSVHVANLGIYSDQGLLGAWLDLPATDAEIAAFKERIAIVEGSAYEKYAIHNYRCEIEGVVIAEYTPLADVNELAKRLEVVNDVAALEALIGYYGDVYKALDVYAFRTMTNTQVQAVIRDLRGRNPLYRRVINEIVRDARDCHGDNLHARITERLDDVRRGLSSGVVGSMVYSTDTVRFFKRYRKYIEELLVEMQRDTGKPWVERLNGFDMHDLFVRDTHNQNLLARAAYDIVASKLNDKLRV